MLLLGCELRKTCSVAQNRATIIAGSGVNPIDLDHGNSLGREPGGVPVPTPQRACREFRDHTSAQMHAASEPALVGLAVNVASRTLRQWPRRPACRPGPPPKSHRPLIVRCRAHLERTSFDASASAVSSSTAIASPMATATPSGVVRVKR